MGTEEVTGPLLSGENMAHSMQTLPAFEYSCPITVSASIRNCVLIPLEAFYNPIRDISGCSESLRDTLGSSLRAGMKTEGTAEQRKASVLTM